MESHRLGADDLFDTEEGSDGLELQENVPMPVLGDTNDDDPMREGDSEDDDKGEDGEKSSVLAKLNALKRGAEKTRVMKPQPKLDSTRLKGENGLAVLPKMFQNVKFKGKGHEASDLHILMTKLEHWSHRLYPKSTFDEFIGRMEKLGQKKDVQTCIKRIRLDMPVLDEDFTNANMYDSDDNTVQIQPSDQQAADQQATTVDDFDAEEAFEEIVREEALRKKQQVMDNFDADDVTPKHDSSRSGANASVKAGDTSPTSRLQQPSSNDCRPDNTPKGMTVEQRQRIQQNKEKALARKAARMGVPLTTLISSQGSSPKPPASDVEQVYTGASSRELSTDSATVADTHEHVVEDCDDDMLCAQEALVTVEDLNNEAVGDLQRQSTVTTVETSSTQVGEKATMKSNDEVLSVEAHTADTDRIETLSNNPGESDMDDDDVIEKLELCISETDFPSCEKPL